MSSREHRNLAIAVAFATCRSTRRWSVRRPRRTRKQSSGPGTAPIAFWRKWRRSARASSRVTAIPRIVSECPPRYFVAEWKTMSAPSSSGFWRAGEGDSVCSLLEGRDRPLEPVAGRVDAPGVVVAAPRAVDSVLGVGRGLVDRGRHGAGGLVGLGAGVDREGLERVVRGGVIGRAHGAMMSSIRVTLPNQYRASVKGHVFRQTRPELHMATNPASIP